MPADLEFTGERFLPNVAGEIAYEHWHRYAFALRHVQGKRVLDAACGEGYGSALLAEAATAVTGVDIDPAAVDHARRVYGGRPHLRYEVGSVTALPLPDASVDAVVSFETIEHLPAADQPAMLAEFARVLAPGGVLVISSPNKFRYSDARNYANPFHLHELYRDDLARALDAHFPHRRWFHQTPLLASAVWSEETAGEGEAWSGDGRTVTPMAVPDGLYYVVVAARDAASLPAASPRISLFVDRDETELKRAAHDAGEVLRLDVLLKERAAALDRASEHVKHLEEQIAVRDEGLARGTAHVRHLEELVAVRDRLVAARDEELVAVNAARAAHESALIDARQTIAELDTDLAEERSERAAADKRAADLDTELRRLDAALSAQERIIAYRQTFAWWVKLPWLRLRLMWQHLAGR